MFPVSGLGTEAVELLTALILRMQNWTKMRYEYQSYRNYGMW